MREILFTILTMGLIMITMPSYMVLIEPETTNAVGSDQEHWYCFRGSREHTGRSPVDTSDNNGKLVMYFKTEGAVCSSPAIGTDGTIYFGSVDGKLYAVGPDGRMFWNFSTGDGIYSSPAIGREGEIYFGSMDGHLYALHPDGTLYWSYGTEGGIRSSPVLDVDGNIIFGSGDGAVRSLDPEGRSNWKFQTKGDVDSSPAIGTGGTVYVGSDDGSLYSILPNGSLNWRFDTGSWVYSSPAIGSDGRVFFGSDDNYLYALNQNGTLAFRYWTGNDVYSSPAVGQNGSIFVGSDNDTLIALDHDGRLLWQFQAEDDIFSSPALDSQGLLYFGSRDGRLYCVNGSGSLVWSYRTVGPISASSPAIGLNKTVYIGSMDHGLYGIGKDMGPPLFVSDLTDNVPTTGDRFTFNVEVNDDNFLNGVTVFVRYWINGNGQLLVSENLSMEGYDGSYSLNITLPLDAEDLQYMFTASDMAGQFSSYPGQDLRRELKVKDNDPPVLVDDTMMIGTTGDPFTFKGVALDNIHVNNVTVTWKHGSKVGHMEELAPSGEDRYELTVELDHDIGPIFYFLTAFDRSGNIIELEEHFVEVSDNDFPMIIDKSPSNGTTGDKYTFEFEVKDNIGIYSTNVEYWKKEGAHENESIHGEGNLSLTIELPYTTREPVYYRLSTLDNSGNRFITKVSSIMVVDNDPPEIIMDRTPSLATTGDKFRFDIEARDNINLTSVVVEYWFENQSHRNMAFPIENPQIMEIYLPWDSTSPLFYRFHLKDDTANRLSTDIKKVEVIDNDAPALEDLMFPHSGTTGENVTIGIVITDNIGISSSYVEYVFDGIPEKLMLGEGTDHELVIDIPDDSITPLRFKILASDLAGNILESPENTISVIDNDAPVIIKDLTPSTVDAGSELDFSIEATDNIGIASVTVDYWFEGSAPVRGTLTGGPTFGLSIDIPSDESGSLRYTITLMDTSGASIMSDERIVEILPIPDEDGTIVPLITLLAITIAAVILALFLIIIFLRMKVAGRIEGGEE